MRPGPTSYTGAPLTCSTCSPSPPATECPSCTICPDPCHIERGDLRDIKAQIDRNNGSMAKDVHTQNSNHSSSNTLLGIGMSTVPPVLGGDVDGALQLVRCLQHLATLKNDYATFLEGIFVMTIRINDRLVDLSRVYIPCMFWCVRPLLYPSA